MLVLAVLSPVALAGAADEKKDAKPAAKDDGAFVGSWTGSWSGSTSGQFEMMVSKDSTGKLGGSITPHGEQGTYTSSFQSLVVEGGKMVAKFDTPDGQLDVVMTATLEGAESKGTYSVHEKAQGSEVDSGSWTAKKN
jgi:hypothetical protein